MPETIILVLRKSFLKLLYNIQWPKISINSNIVLYYSSLFSFMSIIMSIINWIRSIRVSNQVVFKHIPFFNRWAICKFWDYLFDSIRGLMISIIQNDWGQSACSIQECIIKANIIFSLYTQKDTKFNFFYS